MPPPIPMAVVLFLGIISWKGASLFNGGEGGVFFRWGSFIFRWGVHPMGGIGFDWGVSEK